MKRFALLLASTAFVAPAFAADVVYEEPPAPAAYLEEPTATWSGFFVGGQAGGAFNQSDMNITFDADNDGVFGDSGFGNPDDDNEVGFIGGAHAGYDHQMGNFVLGAVVDINYIDAETSEVYTIDGTTSSFAVDQEIDFLATGRLKAGFAADRFMAYATGGLAYANTETTYTAAFTGDEFEGDENDFGYAVGAGADFLVVPNVSIGAEYLYTNLGENEFEIDSVAGNFDAKSGEDVEFHTVLAKASYRFN